MAQYGQTLDLLFDNINHVFGYSGGFVDDLGRLRDVFNSMHVLFSPEGKPCPRIILDKFENLGVETEDEIDMCVFDLLRQRDHKCFFWKVRFKLDKFSCTRRRRQYVVDEEIVRTQTRKLEELYSEFKDYQIQQTIDTASGLCLSSLSPSVAEADGGPWLRNCSYRVEFELEEKVLLGKVVGCCDDSGAVVILIKGLNYSTRSTLAGNVLNNPNVARPFDLVARIWVSRLHTQRECLEAMFKATVELTEDRVKSMSDEYLLLHLERYLMSTPYVIVLDGDCSSKVLNYLLYLLLKNKLRSRIILTAAQVSNLPEGTFSCDLQLLPTEDGWNLLYSKVFGGRGGGECPSKLARIGYKIAEKCAGLPLSIVLVAGLLQWKKTLSWWQRVYGCLGEINVDDESEILELIYFYLPHHLKLCFLYLGHFPGDCEIRSRQLITLWIAEGFVVVPDSKSSSSSSSSSSRQKFMEEVALEYLEDLISWNLVQSVQKRCCGGVKSLRIHNFVRVFCLSKARQVKDLEVQVYDNTKSASLQCMSSRRILLHSGTLHFIKSNPYAPKLRSLICFGGRRERISSRHWKPVCDGYILLRVLELWGVVVDNIPNNIGKLIFLRYLRLKSDSAEVLPSSINNLWNLQTLEVVAPLVEGFQLNVWKMRQLRHFYFNTQIVIPDPLPSSDCLNNLQTLSTISPECCTEGFVSKVPNIVKLGICGDLETHKSAFDNLPKLKLVRKLKLMRNCRYGILTTVPNGDKFPPLLVKLTVKYTELSVDPMKQLAKIPNLQVLKLEDSACGKGLVLDCSNFEFRKLEVLKLVNMGITRWSVSTKSMPSLKNLVVDRCLSLVDLPSNDLKQMSALRELQLHRPNHSTIKCAKEIERYKEEKLEELKLIIYNAPAPRGTKE